MNLICGKPYKHTNSSWYIKRNRWTSDEFTKLTALAKDHILPNHKYDWQMISSKMTRRTMSSCINAFKRINRPWTKEEDTFLKNAVKVHNYNWEEISQMFNSRPANICKEHWNNLSKVEEMELDAMSKTESLSNEEDDQIICEQNNNSAQNLSSEDDKKVINVSKVDKFSIDYIMNQKKL
jgi:hypothetical protein